MDFPMLPLMGSVTWAERALEDLSCGLPILFEKAEGESLFIMPLERFSEDWNSWCVQRKAQVWYAVQSEGNMGFSPFYACPFMGNASDYLKTLSQGKGIMDGAKPVSSLEAETVRDLLYGAELMPCAVVVSVNLDEAKELKAQFGLTAISQKSVQKALKGEGSFVTEVTRAQIPLDHSPENILCVFRSHPDGKDHYVIIVGGILPQESDVPLVRVHAECFTGDLLASLKCDCGSQLTNAISLMAQAGGGILLYLRQEGRGIGLTNKLRAYALQDQGFDTVDANLKLGFSTDHRNFQTAAHILKYLGIRKINILTNNPLKIDALVQYGLEIVERTPLIVGINSHNEGYLSVKQKRSGHFSQ